MMGCVWGLSLNLSSEQNCNWRDQTHKSTKHPNILKKLIPSTICCYLFRINVNIMNSTRKLF